MKKANLEVTKRAWVPREKANEVPEVQHVNMNESDKAHTEQDVGNAIHNAQQNMLYVGQCGQGKGG